MQQAHQPRRPRALVLLALALVLSPLAAAAHAKRKRSTEPLAAFTARIVVQRPARFDLRLQAALVSGILSQVATPDRSAWVSSTKHRTSGNGGGGGGRDGGSAEAVRKLMRRKRKAGVEYTLEFVIRGETKADAEAARNQVVSDINAVGICGLRMQRGITGVCDYAADYAQIDAFSSSGSLQVASASAEVTKVPSGETESPVCRVEGQSCDGAASKCCSWGMLDCDLRPGVPTYGTCTSLTGPTGYTCTKQGKACESSAECCPYLQCAPDGAKGAKTCSFAPEHASISVNITLSEPAQFSAKTQHGLMSALQHWLLHGSPAAASSVRVVGYEPLRAPANGTRWDRTFRYEVVISAPTRAAVDSAVMAALKQLKSKPGKGGSVSGGICDAKLAIGGNVCTLAEARCAERSDPPQPCKIRVEASSAATVASVPANYKQPTCRAKGNACEGPFGVAGACCGSLMCASDVPGQDPLAQTGVCLDRCATSLMGCSKDSDCCNYWGPQVCNPNFGMCLPAEINVTALAKPHH